MGTPPPTSPSLTCTGEEVGDTRDLEMHGGGGGGGQTDGRALAYRIHYEKAINFPRRFFFFLSVSFKKITIILPLPQQLTGLYSTTGQGRAGGEGRREGGRVKDFINKRQVPDLQFVNIS